MFDLICSSVYREFVEVFDSEDEELEQAIQASLLDSLPSEYVHFTYKIKFGFPYLLTNTPRFGVKMRSCSLRS